MDSTERAEHSIYLLKNHNLRTPELDNAEMPEGWVVDGRLFSNNPGIVARIQVHVIPLMPKDNIFSMLHMDTLRAFASELSMLQRYGQGVYALIQRGETWIPFYLLANDLLHGEPENLLEEARVSWTLRDIKGGSLRAIKEGAYISLTGQDPGDEY